MVEEKEYWKPIEGFRKGWYVSNKGRIWNDREKRFVEIDGLGRFNIYTVRGNRTKAGLGLIVGEAFVPNPNHYSFIRKIDAKGGWTPENMEWVKHVTDTPDGNWMKNTVYTTHNQLVLIAPGEPIREPQTSKWKKAYETLCWYCGTDVVDCPWKSSYTLPAGARYTSGMVNSHAYEIVHIEACPLFTDDGEDWEAEPSKGDEANDD